MAYLATFDENDRIIRIILFNELLWTPYTGITSATAGLKISTIASSEAAAVVYTSSAGTIETIPTLGTYSAPTTTKCRFKEVDATNHPGLYEIQLNDARFSVVGTTSMVVTVSGVLNMTQVDLLFNFTRMDLQATSVVASTVIDKAGYTVSTVQDKTGYSVSTVLDKTGYTASTVEDKTGYTVSTVQDKTGYAITQAFPTNFSSMIVSSDGKVYALGATAPTVNEIDDYLTLQHGTGGWNADSPTVQEIDAQLSSSHGTGLWALNGTGAIEWIYVVTDAITHLPIEGVAVKMTSDLAGKVIIASATTDAAGEALFYLDPATYYVWCYHEGYNFNNPDIEIVTA